MESFEGTQGMKWAAMKEAAMRDAARVAELHSALKNLRSACTRYDEMPDSLVARAKYDAALAAADAALNRK